MSEPTPVAIPQKRYFKIGEVCRLTGVKQHVLRYWESEFPELRPRRAGSRQRLYRREDVLCVLTIKRLLHEEGFTIAGARRVLAGRGGPVAEEGSAAEDGGGDACRRLVATVRRELSAIKAMLERPHG